MDVAMRFDPLTQTVDIAMDGPDLAADDTLESAVIVSVFADARAHPDDVIPTGNDDPRGWWADRVAPYLRPNDPSDRTGSRLWLLRREKQIPATLVKIKAYLAECLAWMVTDGLVAAVDVEAGFPKRGSCLFAVNLTKPDGTSERYGYNLRWGA